MRRGALLPDHHLQPAVPRGQLLPAGFVGADAVPGQLRLPPRILGADAVPRRVQLPAWQLGCSSRAPVMLDPQYETALVVWLWSDGSLWAHLPPVLPG